MAVEMVRRWTCKVTSPCQSKQQLAAPVLSAGSVVSKMCGTHIVHPLLLFCETCNLLICAMCAVFDHAGHVYKEVQEAVDAHRAMIEAAVAAMKIARQEAIAATNAIKAIRGGTQREQECCYQIHRRRVQPTEGRVKGAGQRCLQ